MLGSNSCSEEDTAKREDLWEQAFRDMNAEEPGEQLGRGGRQRALETPRLVMRWLGRSRS